MAQDISLKSLSILSRFLAFHLLPGPFNSFYCGKIYIILNLPLSSFLSVGSPSTLCPFLQQALLNSTLHLVAQLN